MIYSPPVGAKTFTYKAFGLPPIVRSAHSNQHSGLQRAWRLTMSVQPNEQDQSNTIKNPDEWTTGDEKMTGAQRSYLKTLCDEAKEEFDENLTKAEASKRIDELQHKTGRGLKEQTGDQNASADQAQR